MVPTASGYWFDASRFFYLSAPPHRLYSPHAEELRAVRPRTWCLGVRFAAPIEGEGKLSYQIACDNHAYGLEALSGNARSKVRRGLKRCTVRPVPFAVIASADRRAHDDTVARQERDGVLAGDRWGRFFAAAAATPGIESWGGAWCGEELAAFLVTVTFDDALEFMLTRSRSDLLGAYPNNALIFSVTEEMLVRRRVREIAFGLESLEPVGPLDDFKFGMGFRANPLRQRIIFHPAVRGLLRHAAHGGAAVDRTARRRRRVLAQGRRGAALRRRSRRCYPRMSRLAYLFPAFPVFHQTFVLWEVLGLQRNGVNPRIYSLPAASARQQPEGRRDVIANVVVEAMAAGLPVVASRIAGAEELVDDGVTGYLVRPNDTDELVAALQRLAEHAADRARLGQAARRRILRDFDSKENVRALA